MDGLRGDTLYRIQIRAHNAIGFSKPVTLLMKTAIGESPNALGARLYYGHTSSASSIYYYSNYNFITRLDCMLFMLSSFFGFYNH